MAFDRTAGTGRHSVQLEVRDLRLVAAVCAEGSLTRAAARLNVTQPALSRHLATLEARVAQQLFTRKGLRMIPTAAGELLLRRAREVIEKLDETESELRELIHDTRQLVRVGVDCYTGYHWLPAVVSRYSARHAGIDVQIAFGAAGNPVKQLLAGTIDLALITDDSTYKGCVSRPLFSDEYVAVVAPGHSLCNRTFVSPEELQDQRILLMSDPANSNVIRRFLVPAGVKPRYVADVQLVGAVAALAESRFGVGLVPSWTIAPEVRAGRLVALRLGRRGFVRTWSAVMKKAQAREPWLDDFCSAISTEGVATGFMSAG